MLMCPFIRRTLLAFAIAICATLTGCASIVSGTTQVVSIDANLSGKPVDGAKCKLTNSKGTYYVTAPGTVPVHRDYSDLAVTCAKDELPTGTATVKSTMKGMAAGNILFGGAIGITVDASSGAAYDYPEVLHILMGQSIALGGKPTASPSPATAAFATTAVPNTPQRQMPSMPPEQWDARLSCGAKMNELDGKPYNVKFKMEVRGNSVNLRRQTSGSVELMSGETRNGELVLSGNGFMIDNSKRPWNFSLRGDMPSGATTYLAKGAMLTNDKPYRACQLSAVRMAAPQKFDTVAAAPSTLPAAAANSPS